MLSIYGKKDKAASSYNIKIWLDIFVWNKVKIFPNIKN